MAIDITVYVTAFQGRALEPVTDAGREWCEGHFAIADSDPDFEPFTIFTDARDFDDFFDDAEMNGLTLGTSDGGVIVRRA